MLNALILIAGLATAGLLLWPPLARSRLWRATVTPLASIIGSGFLVQQFARRIYVPGSIILAKLAYSLILMGMVLAVATTLLLESAGRSIALGIVAAVVLGSAYGMALQCGLLEVQRYAHRSNLAAFTAVFYSLAYLGFGFPMILSALSDLAPYPLMLGVGAFIAAASGILMFIAVKLHNRR